MPGQITFEFFGEQQLSRTLLRWADHVEDLRPAWDAIVDDFLEIEERQFDSEGRHGSGGWDPLSPDYAAWKLAQVGPKPILEFTGDLRRSLTDGPEVRILEHSWAVFGSADPKGAYHQQGTDRMPRRPPVDLTEAERRRWVKMVQRYIVEGSPT